MHNKQYDIAFCCDRWFLKNSFVSASSCILNLRRESVSLHILHPGDIKEEDVGYFSKIFPNVSIHLYTVSMEIIENEFKITKKNAEFYYKNPTYYRLLLPYFLPDKEKVLYFDGDVIFCKSPMEYFSSNYNDSLFVWVEDVYEVSWYTEIAKRFNLKSYINAWIVLYNLSKKNEVKKWIIKFFAEYNKEDIQYNDQDIINIVWKWQIWIIDQKYNVLNIFWKKEYILTLRSLWKNKKALSYENAIQDPYAIHFAWSPKPWKILSYNSLRYYRYLYEYKLWLSNFKEIGKLCLSYILINRFTLYILWILLKNKIVRNKINNIGKKIVWKWFFVPDYF